MSASDLSDFLHKRAKELNLTALLIAKKARISRQTWYRLLNAEVKHLRIETLERIADVLQVSLIELSYLYTKQQNFRQKPLISTVNIHDNPPFIIKTKDHFDKLVNKQEQFTNEWHITNKSHHYWVNRRLVCIDEVFEIRLRKNHTRLCSGKHYGGLKPERKSIDIPLTAPGERIVLSMDFHAPEEPGSIISFWKMVNAHGEYCFPDNVGLWCHVKVIENSVGVAEIDNWVG